MSRNSNTAAMILALAGCVALATAAEARAGRGGGGGGRSGEGDFALRAELQNPLRHSASEAARPSTLCSALWRAFFSSDEEEVCRGDARALKKLIVSCVVPTAEFTTHRVASICVKVAPGP